MLTYCKTCGRLFTPHAFKVHRQPICIALDSELRRAGLFSITLDPLQAKKADYPVKEYWADLAMFSGLSKEVIPWEWIQNKGILPAAYNRNNLRR